MKGKGSFHSVGEIERLLERKPEALKDIVFELRNLIAETAPYATEKIQWKGMSYYDASRGGVVKGGICQIELHAEHVRLSFIHGAFIEDPQGLLQGERIAKRFVRLESYESTPWEALGELIRAAARFDPVSLSNLQGSLKSKGGLTALIEERQKDKEKRK